ncbi:MAG: adenosylmethionine--8-amino-7-oxononanoate transaminase [Myxococcales bacterium]|nr:adenosylmethionine--8-amino-7-oxononanoate transaminase [Myxococcales bacterium]
MSQGNPGAAPAHSQLQQTLHDDLHYIWHPFTPLDHRQRNDDLPVVVSAKGVWMHTADGRQLLDATGSWWVSNLGHRPERVVAALHRQLDLNPHTMLAETTHPGAAELARRLVEIAPAGLQRVFWSDNGSTAVEVALQTAFQYWQQNGRPARRLFLTFRAGYHGDTMAALSVGGIDFFRKRFERLTFETLRAPSPVDVPDNRDSAVAASFDKLASIAREHASELAGIIIEPLIQGAGGMLMYPPEWLTRLRALCDELDTFLIADEVFTGFGRTLRMFACEHAGITPDFLCLSKGLTAGTLPFGATLSTARIYDGFQGGMDRALLYGHSYCGNPLGCAAALAVLDTFAQDDILAQATRSADVMRDRLSSLTGENGVADVRQTGFVAAVQLQGDADYRLPIGRQVAALAQARGIFLRPLGNVVYLVPALNISATDLAFLLDGTLDAIRTALHDRHVE